MLRSFLFILLLSIFIVPASFSQQGFTNYTVGAAEGFYTVSKKFNVSKEDIIKYNPEAENGLKLGQVLKIPTSVVKTNDKKDNYIKHEVQPQETLYSLSRLYQVSIDNIIKLNPVLATTPLKIGMIVRIASDSTSKMNFAAENKPKYFYHDVAPKEALYGISKYFNVPQDTVKALNPGIDFEHLPIGAKVKLPVTDANASLLTQPKLFMYYTVPSRISLRKLANEFNTTQERLKALNPGYVKGKINGNVVVRVPLQGEWQNAIEITPEDTAKEEQEAEKQYVILPKTPQTLSDINVVLLLPFSLDGNSVNDALNKSNHYVEFYSGILVAIDHLRDSGIRVHLTSFDTQKSNASITSILNKPALKTADLIIGPAYSSQIAAVARFASQNQVMVILPFSTQESDVAENPYLIQINAGKRTFESLASSTIASQFTEGNLVIIDPANKSRQQFVDQLADQIAKKNNEGNSRLNIKHLDITSITRIKDQLSNINPNYILIASNNVADVSRALPQIRTALSKGADTHYNIQLLGFPEWLTFKGIDQDELHAYNFTTLCTSFTDYNDPNTIDFLKAYRTKFNTEPAAGYPCYGTYGYDIMNYFAQAIYNNGKNFQSELSNSSYNQLGSHFLFERKNLWSGYINKGMLFIQFTPDYNIKVINKL